MTLSGAQHEKIKKALIDAFPDKFSLQQFLSEQFSQNLLVIADGDSLQQIVYKLIQTAKAQGWIQDLVIKAAQYVPGNEKLQFLLLEQDINIFHGMIREKALEYYQIFYTEFLCNDGVITLPECLILENLKETFELTDEETSFIKNKVDTSIQRYLKNLYFFKVCYIKLIEEQGYPLNANTKKELKMLQNAYDIDDDDVIEFENEIRSHLNIIPENTSRKTNGQRGLFSGLSKLFGKDV